MIVMDYEQLFESLPIGDFDKIRRTFKLLKALSEVNPDLTDLDKLTFFFRNVLTPYYDCMWDGLKTDCGHLIYHLSSKIPSEIRMTIDVYPIIGLEPWTTLEDWRIEWMQRHLDGIPEFPQLSEIIELFDAT